MPDFLDLVHLLLEAARDVGAKVEPAAPEWTGPRFNSEVLGEAVAFRQPGEQDGAPLAVAAARIDDIPVLFGELGKVPVSIALEPQLKRYRYQAMIARSWLAAEAANLQLFLISPASVAADSRWRRLAAEIEADDRTCRKLVWLRADKSPPVDAREFLDRTFVARPWPAERQRALLDAMATFELPEGWEGVIEDPDLDYDGLVERLIEIGGEA